MAANGFRDDDKQKIGDGFVGLVTWQQDLVVLGGPAGVSFPPIFLRPRKYQKKSLAQQADRGFATSILRGWY